ncbi:hypothetical protein AC1031_016892 [Aphanomyces cochlioides]|nr:hypothetical protein AC1031_016892 [Aphanomyces cochlioides]
MKPKMHRNGKQLLIAMATTTTGTNSSLHPTDDHRTVLSWIGQRRLTTSPFWPMYPNAKLILTVRDSAAQWLESMKATLGASKDGQASDFAELKQQIIWNHPDMFGGGFPENAIQVYNAWNAKVQADIPADRLLVLNVKDGWRPLCEFLGVPVTDGPFPHANDRESYILRHQNIAQ